jgi:nucleotide-binding universal stress UspA family protein
MRWSERIMNVLLVVNENPVSVDLVRSTLSLSDGHAMRVCILFPIPLQNRPDLGPLDREWLANRAEVVIEKVGDVFRARGIETELLVRFGPSTPNVIIEQAQKCQADWIVLGQKLDDVVDGWLADTTVQYVSNYAPCAVRVVPLESWHGTL